MAIELQWGQPGYALAGTAAAMLPILAHLLRQAAGQPVLYPTLRFLRPALAQARRHNKPRDLLLLALRCLIVLLAGCALAQPTILTATAASASPASLHIFLLDRSASMNRSSSSTLPTVGIASPLAPATLFDLGRQSVVAKLQALDPARDLATVVLIDASPRTLLPAPTAQFHLLADALRSAQLSHDFGDAAGALAIAQSLAQQFPNLRTLVHLHSDFQASAFAFLKTPNPNSASIQLEYHPVGTPAENFSLHDLRLSTASIHSQQRAEICVQVVWHPVTENAPRREIPVQLQVADQLPQRASVSLYPHMPATVTFPITIPSQPALVQCSLLLADALQEDNQAGLVLHPQPPAKVLVLTKDREADNASPAFYLLRAIQPTVNQAYQASRMSPQDWSEQHSAAQGQAQFLWLCGAQDPGAAATAQLASALTSGSAVIWNIDSPQAAQAVSRLLEQLGGDAAELSPEAAPRMRKLASGEFDQPPLRAFDGTARAALLDASFRTFSSLHPRDGARVLLRYEDDQPALLAVPSGLGVLLIWNADLWPQAGDFVRQPSFVPLVHEMLASFGRSQPASSPTVGRSWSFELPASDSPVAQLLTPTGKTLPLTLARTRRQMNLLSLDKVREPGVHTITLAGPPQRQLPAFVAGIDPSESDLRRAELPASKPETQAVAAAAGQRELELWPALLLAMLALACAEQLILGPWLLRQASASEASRVSGGLTS